MLIEKEIIGPGTYWYTDDQTGLPRKLDVNSDMTKYWHEQGSAMLASGLTIPVPYEHDFTAHPMTPKEKLLNNAGEVKEYRLRGDSLFGVVDVQDPEAKKKIGHSIRWTSPWINSFTDGNGRAWKNVISHLALTTRPRITKQAPFSSIAAALSMASPIKVTDAKQGLLDATVVPKDGFCLSKAGRLVRRKSDKRICPLYPIAFSLTSGVVLAEGDFPPKKDKKDKKSDDKKSESKPSDGKSEATPSKPSEPSESSDDSSDFEEMDGGEITGGAKDGNAPSVENGGGGEEIEPFQDQAGDVSMEEVLCDLLGALGIHCQKTGSDEMFKRSLYNAAMTKIHELTGLAQNDGMDPNRANPPGQPPNNPASPPAEQGQNPLVQQEQQPMYMSLEEINKLPDPMKSVALAMYTENQKLRAEMEANAKTSNSLRDAKLRDENAKRAARVALLSRLSPKLKADLDAMVAAPSMALSMGDGGSVMDPMEQTLTMLEKGLSDMPRLLTADHTALSVQAHPTDSSDMTDEQSDALADNMARMMGCPPAKQAS